MPAYCLLQSESSYSQLIVERSITSKNENILYKASAVSSLYPTPLHKAQKRMNIGKRLFSRLIILGIAAAFLISLLVREVPAFNKNEEVRVGIVMYHSILNDKNKAGKYVITPQLLEEDFKYLKENGYTPVYVSELIDWVKNGTSLPEKPVVISFDDGYYNNYSYALPLLEKFDFKAVISIIGKYTDEYSASSEKPNNNYSHATWENLSDMAGRFEILNHTYNMHSAESRKGLMRFPNEGIDKYNSNISDDVLLLQRLLKSELDIDCRTFTYPYGYISEESEVLIRNLGFEASLSCYEHINTLTHNPNCLYSLGRYNRPYGIPSEVFFSGFDY